MAKKTVAVSLVALLLLLVAVPLALVVVGRSGSPVQESETEGTQAASDLEASVEGVKLRGRSQPEEQIALGPPAPRVVGRVVDALDRPVGGARVSIHPQMFIRRPVLALDSTARVSTVSDEDGRFAVAVDDNHRAHVAAAQTADGRSVRQEGIWVGTPVVLRLEPPQSVIGNVWAMNGEAVIGATVTLDATLAGQHVHHRVESDEQGRFRFDAVSSHSASLLLCARASGFAPTFLRLNRSIGSWDSAVPVDLVLAEGTAVEGRVLFGDSDTPVGGAHVLLVSHEVPRHEGGMALGYPSRLLGEATTGKDGRFRFTGVPGNGFRPLRRLPGGTEGRLVATIYVWKDRFAPARADVPVLPDGGVLERIVRLHAAGGVVGRVVDPVGKPVAGATVWAWTEGRPGCSGVPSPYEAIAAALDKTDADGRFELLAVEAAASGPVEVLLHVYRPLSQRPPPNGPIARAQHELHIRAGKITDAGTIVLELPAHHVTRVHVTDVVGQPISGALLSLGSTSRCSTDGEGHGAVVWEFQMDAAHLIVRAPGFATTTRQVLPRAPDEAHTVEIVMQPGRRLGGVVVHEDGTPAPGALVVTVADGHDASDEAFARDAFLRLVSEGPQPGGMYAQLATDGRGAFLCTELPPGPYQVRVATALLRDVGPREDLRIVIAAQQPARGSVLRGRVVDARSGEPIPVFEVGFASPDARGMALRRTAPGRFEATGVPPGRWEMVVEAEGYDGHPPQAVVVDAGEPVATMEVRLEPESGVTVQGRATSPEGVALAGRWLSLVRIDGGGAFSAGRSGAFRADGTFRIGAVEPGRYRVAAWLPNSPWCDPLYTQQDVEVVQETGSLVLTLALRRGGLLDVWVNDPSVPGRHEEARENEEGGSSPARLEVRDAADEVIVAQTVSSRGIVAVALSQGIVLAPGTYVVRLVLADGSVREENVTIQAGERSRVDFR